MARTAPKTPDVKAALRAEREREAKVRREAREAAEAEKAAKAEQAKREAEAEAARIREHEAEVAAKAEQVMVDAWTVDAKAIWEAKTPEDRAQSTEAEFVTAYIAEQRTPPAKAKQAYDGPMVALKSARTHYVKAANGILCNGDGLALICGAHSREETVKALIVALKLPGNPYSHLNPGQQSMNLRNRARHALQIGTLTMAEVEAAFKA